jgi:hypothetical protein
MLAFASSNAAYLTGLESALPEGRACLMVGTGGTIAEMLRRNGRVAFALDEDPQMLAACEGHAMSSGVVIGAAPVVQILEDSNCDAVLPFKSGARLWTMAERLGLHVLAVPFKLARQLENKLMLAELAAAADARIPDTVTVRLDEDLARAALADGIALPRVFQPAVSFAGAGTVLLRTGADIAELVAAADKGRTVGKLVEYVEGDPVTVNAVVVPAGVHGASDDSPEVLVGMVTRQLTGIEGLTPSEFGSCGNDWCTPPDRAMTAAIRALVNRVGEVLAQRGFVGAFGIDIVVPAGGGAPVLIEINPRWTASLALQVELQSRRGLPTLLDAHLAAFGYRPQERPSLAELLAAYGPGDDAGCVRAVDPISTLIAFNRDPVPAFVDRTAEPGVWRSVGDASAPSVERVRDGWRLADLRSDDPSEFILLPQGTERGIAHAAHLARVDLRGPVAADAAARTLRPDAAALMRAVVARVTS